MWYILMKLKRNREEIDTAKRSGRVEFKLSWNWGGKDMCTLDNFEAKFGTNILARENSLKNRFLCTTTNFALTFGAKFWQMRNC